jgi:hypothetical protein
MLAGTTRIAVAVTAITTDVTLSASGSPRGPRARGGFARVPCAASGRAQRQERGCLMRHTSSGGVTSVVIATITTTAE